MDRTSHAQLTHGATRTWLMALAGTLATLGGIASAGAQRAPTPPAPPPPPAAPRVAPVSHVNASGWVGISIIQQGTGDESGVSIGYPLVASVEPGSPAAKAGVVAGDTVLAYNDADARTDPLAMRRFLIPGQRFMLKVRRNGVREIPIIVSTRTSGHNSYAVGVTVNESGRGADALPPALLGGPGVLAAPVSLSREAPIAGAMLVRVNAGLARVLKLRDGVLVTDIGPGSPAARSGLEQGDVIVRADSFDVTSPVELVRALHAASDHTVLLQLVREGKAEKLTLRW